MRRFSCFALFFALFSTGLFAQKILAFDKTGKVKRVRYYDGEYISFKTTKKVRVRGVIGAINNESFIVNEREYKIDSIRVVYNTQTGLGFRLVRNIFILPAIGYMPLITFNGLINKDKPIIKQNRIYYGGGFIAVALISHALANRPFRISEKRPLKVIDISI